MVASNSISSDAVFTEGRMSRHAFSKAHLTAHPEIALTVRGADAAASELEV